MEIKVIYIGRHFYNESGTAMSSLYTEAGNRYDHGFMERDLMAGNRVTIRPATDIELAHYERQLREWKTKLERRHA